MWTKVVLDSGFFAGLVALDEQIARRVAEAGCQHCGGPLHRADYERKPRGAHLAVAGEAFRTRFSLCCGTEGCRKRALPPSVRFLGRRVYLEGVVLIASVLALMHRALRKLGRRVGVPARTLQRWGTWWRESFPTTRCWLEVRAGFAPPPPDEGDLPRSWIDRLVERTGSATDALGLASLALAPVTTASVPNPARFLGESGHAEDVKTAEFGRD